MTSQRSSSERVPAICPINCKCACERMGNLAPGGSTGGGRKGLIRPGRAPATKGTGKEATATPGPADNAVPTSRAAVPAVVPGAGVGCVGCDGVAAPPTGVSPVAAGADSASRRPSLALPGASCAPSRPLPASAPAPAPTSSPPSEASSSESIHAKRFVLPPSSEPLSEASLAGFRSLSILGWASLTSSTSGSAASASAPAPSGRSPSSLLSLSDEAPSIFSCSSCHFRFPCFAVCKMALRPSIGGGGGRR
mmetsp:Transcript_32665/g.90070  ORF Transcript_32665/g.90070 Transcript_32665/m.90070 type:complete len:251 (-) Transcript_32665:150-902(-)